MEYFYCILLGGGIDLKKQAVRGKHVKAKQVEPQQPKHKMNPQLLRLMVIFPNVLSYLLLIGVVVFTISNFKNLEQAGNLWFWLLTLAVLAFLSVSTTISISKKLKAGSL